MKIFIFIFYVFWTSSVFAQKMVVYSVMGKVTEKSAGKECKLLPKTNLSLMSYIVMEGSSRIVLLDEIKKEMYTLKGAAEGKVCLLLKGNTVVKKKLPPQYFSVLMNKLSGAVSRNAYMQSAATSFREAEELMEKFDSLKSVKDSVKSMK